MRFSLFLLSCIALSLTVPAQQRGQGREGFKFGDSELDVEVNTDTSAEVAWGYDAYTVYNLTAINSPALEYAPSVTADGKTLYFVSNRSDGFGGHDIWSAVKTDPLSAEFSAPLNVGPPVNTDLNEGVTSIAPDGMTIYFTGCNRPDGLGDCDIYEARLEGETWRDVRNLGAVNSDHWDSQPSISGSGDTLYFLSNRPGALGGANDADIYMAVRNSGGEWEAPVNLGGPVNTKFREDSPFILPGSNKLYFSSAGHGGYGKLDFFVTEQGSDGEWGEVQNLGPVFNTAQDERMLSGLPDEGVFYFASERTRPSNLGALDIFMAVRPASSLPDDADPVGEGIQLVVEPNPARDRISVQVAGEISEKTPVEIFNARGILLLRFTLKEAKESISVESLPSGFYFMKAGASSTTFVVRQ